MKAKFAATPKEIKQAAFRSGLSVLPEDAPASSSKLPPETVLLHAAPHDACIAYGQPDAIMRIIMRLVMEQNYCLESAA